MVMAREILEAHGGRMWCEPVAPRGSALLFELPLPGGLDPQEEEVAEPLRGVGRDQGGELETKP